jgi:hypothetical protein
MKSVLAAASHRGDPLRSDERDHIPAPMPDRHLDNGFSHRDEVTCQQDLFTEVRTSNFTVIQGTEYVIEVLLVSQQRIV